MLATRVSAAFAALAASVALPLLVHADPSQAPAAGFLLSLGTPQTLVLDHAIDSAHIEPGDIVPAHLRAAIVVRGKTLAPAGEQVHLLVTEVRRAGNGASGQVVLRVEPLHLAENLTLPVRLPHPALSPLLVLADTDDVVIPARAKSDLHQGGDLFLPAGTQLRARTAATIDATDPEKITVASPPPYTLSTERPYAAFTPIPLTTYNPTAFTPPPRGRRGRHAPSPSPSPSASPSASPAPSTSPP